MLVWFILIFVTSFPLNSAQDFPQPFANYLNNKELVAGVYKFYWNFTKTSIIGEIHAKTNGWVGFGISPNGGMVGSDVIVAWINLNGFTNFTDRFITSDRQVLIDISQDWQLLKSARVNSFLIIQFARNISTCDPYETDQVIQPGSIRVIFAWDDQLPIQSNDISYHGFNNRGTKSIQLISRLNQEVKITADDMIESYNFNVNVTLPTIETYYHCHMFKLPQKLIDNKRHLIRTFTNITPGNEKYLHHLLVYHCGSSYESKYLKSNPPPLPGHCYDQEFTNSANPLNTWNSVSDCKQLSLGWAVGRELVFDFPSGFGLPIGGSDREFTYFCLEIHYNNPELKSDIRDTSGIQMFLTPKLRKTEVGVFTTGTVSTMFGILIPPEQESFKLTYACRKNCLDKFYGGQPVTVFAAAAHTHVTGSEVYTTLVRNGTEIAYIDKNPYYDFNYQNFNFLQEPIVLQPGDEFHTTCVYKTINKRNYTLGGRGTSQEMCLEFFYYYPRRPLMGVCHSFPSEDNWKKLINELASNGSIKLSKNPPDYQSLINDVKTLKSDMYTISAIRNFFDSANRTQNCIFDNNVYVTTNPRLNLKPIIEKDLCIP